jgi:ribonuclease Z
VRLPARTAFSPEPLPARPFDGILVDTDTLTVTTAHLDHRIPCLGFALTEKTRLNVRADALDGLGVPPGRWLNRLKDAVRAGEPDESELVAEWHVAGEQHRRRFTVGELRDRLLVETRGQKLAYVVDTLFSQANLERIGVLARDADVFFCESLFLDADRDQASKRYHLTARQAATLARAAGVARLETFHFSSRYDRDPAPLRAEAQAVFRGELPPDVPS